jgi:copper oxidase (laccase) domain-containing protein
LPGLARARLLKAGVQHVECSGLCSYEQDDLFYSYRRDAASGRMATLAWLSGSSAESLTFI